MNKYIFTIYTGNIEKQIKTTYTRITKKQAIKAHEAGLPVAIAGCKANLNSPFINPFIMGKEADFNKYLNNWNYYNSCSELGYYPAFYAISESTTTI